MDRRIPDRRIAKAIFLGSPKSVAPKESEAGLPFAAIPPSIRHLEQTLNQSKTEKALSDYSFNPGEGPLLLGAYLRNCSYQIVLD